MTHPGADESFGQLRRASPTPVFPYVSTTVVFSPAHWPSEVFPTT
jgi:hypothetical protein